VYRYYLTGISGGSVNNDVSNIIVGRGWETTPILTFFVFKSLKHHPTNYYYTFFITTDNKLFRFNRDSRVNSEHTQSNSLLTTKTCMSYNENMFIVGGNGASASIIYVIYSTSFSNPSNPTVQENFVNATSAFSLMSTVNSIVFSRSVILRRWVAVGEDNSTNNSIIYSDDGINWLAATNTHFTSGISVNWHNDHFIALGSGGTSDAVYSYDGITWSSQVSASDLLVGATPVSIESYSNRMTKGITVSNNINGNASTVGDNFPFRYLVGGPSEYSENMYYLSNEGSYIPTTLKQDYGTINHIAVNTAGTFWVGANTSTILMTSTNGINWSPVPSGQRPVGIQEGRGVAYGLDGSGNGLWVLVGASNNGNKIASSYDGLNWTARGIIFENQMTPFQYFGRGNKVLYANNLWVAVGKGINNHFASSTDGLSWVGNGLGSFGYDNSGVYEVLGIAYINNLWIATGSGATQSLATSSDGTTWTGIGGKTDLFTVACYAIAYNNGLYVAVGSGTVKIATTTDLITWTPRSISPATMAQIYDVKYSPNPGTSGGLWIVVGLYTSGMTIGTSTDGLTWTAIYIGLHTYNLYTIALHPNFGFIRSKPYVAQVLVFNRILTNEQRQQVQSELYYKTGKEYNLLPSNAFYAGPEQSIVIQNADNRLFIENARAIGIGSNAGFTGQQYGAIAIGTNAAKFTQQNGAVSIGLAAGLYNQGQNAYAMGFSAGANYQASGSMALGYFAGYNYQKTFAIAIGYSAGYSNQGFNALAIGREAAYLNQQTNAIAVGYQAGYSSQGENSLAIGFRSGYYQSSNAVALGYLAGNVQGNASVAIGFQAGGTQGVYSVAIGYQTGGQQSDRSLALGSFAGYTAQSSDSTAVGFNAGYRSQGSFAVAIGSYAGYASQSSQSVSIGVE
jgi:hypothetical protein